MVDGEPFRFLTNPDQIGGDDAVLPPPDPKLFATYDGSQGKGTPGTAARGVRRQAENLVDKVKDTLSWQNGPAARSPRGRAARPACAAGGRRRPELGDQTRPGGGSPRIVIRSVQAETPVAWSSGSGSPEPALYRFARSPREEVVMVSAATDPTNTPAEERVYFRDIKPYAVVDGLDRLRGPADGVLELPHSVLWAPGGGRIDLDRPGELRLAYRAVLNEGSIDDLERLLNRDRLVAVWSDLLLPLRVLELWESRFPELRTSPDRSQRER